MKQSNFKKILFIFLIFPLLLQAQVDISDESRRYSVAQSDTNDSTGFSISQSDTNEIHFDNQYSVNFLSILARAFSSLIIIIILIFVLAFLYKKFYLNRKQPVLNNKVKILGSVAINPKNNVVFLKVLDKVLIIGSTEENLSLLGEITNVTDIAKIEKTEQMSCSPTNSFNNLLKSMMKKK